MHRWTIAAAVTICLFTGCYQDDTVHGPASMAPTRVLLTDDPFPFDSVASVNLFVTRIEASAQFDTSGAGNWVEIVAPRKSFDLLTLQQGTTALVGQSIIDAGQYATVRMTIDVDKSSIKYPDGSDAIVHWPGTGELTFYALVEEPVGVAPGAGAELVIDFDVGRSFLYRLFGVKAFYATPVLRAVNSAATGAIEGTVTGTANVGAAYPLANANVTVYGGDPHAAATAWWVVATGHTDNQGRYKIGFLLAGSYIVRVEQPIIPAFAAVTTPNVSVSVGQVTPYDIQLPRADAGLHITGSTLIGINSATLLQATVSDASGNPVSAAIDWVSRDSSIAMPVDSALGDTLQSSKFILGTQVGSAWIVASSGVFSDSALIQVVAEPNPNAVATVVVSPSTLDLAVGDSTFLTAELRDQAGTILTDRQIAWLPADSSGVVDLLVAVGPTAVLKARHTGSVVIRAVSEGKAGSAAVTVH